MPDPLELAIADMRSYDRPGKVVTDAEVEDFRKAVEAGLCVPVHDDEKDEWTFELTQAGCEIIVAGGTVAGKSMRGSKGPN